MIAERDLERVHDAALRLLHDVGCAVLDPEALALLEAHGAVVDGERVRFGEELRRGGSGDGAGRLHRGRPAS